MSSLLSACKRLGILVALGALPLLAAAQPRFDSQGDEYRIVGPLSGDQTFPQMAINVYGGYLVWQDNATDGDGLGISARRLNRSFSGSLGIFRVNEAGAGDQTLPQVALLNDGGAVFVWQSALGANVRVYARFVKPDGTFATGDVPVSNYSGGDQTTPAVAVLKDGTVIVVWASIGQERLSDGRPVANGMQGVFAQKFSPTSEKIGGEFQVNTTAPLNQRNPVVAALENGHCAVVWVSEVYRGTTFSLDENRRTTSGAGLDVFDVTVSGQVLAPTGAKVGGELKISSATRICANPSLAATGDGFLVAWSGKAAGTITETERQEGWDVYARVFDSDGSPKQSEFRINSYTYGDQFRPMTAFQDDMVFLVWTSLLQDGSREGVTGRLLSTTGSFMSREFRVNTTTAGSQVYPTVAGTGERNFLAVWTSFVGGVNGFDLFAQRYSSSAQPTLAAPAAPRVSALSQTRLSVTWPVLAGYQGVKYEIYVDQQSVPVVVENNTAVIVSLAPDSTHAFRLAYVLPDGRRSPLSEPGMGKTWSEDGNYDGLPDDWQAGYWGENPAVWPAAHLDSDGDGATNLQELLAGTDPTDPASVLRVRMIATSQGPRLEWNTTPGFVYQVQLQDVDWTWLSLGTPRFAPGTVDSVPLVGQETVALYRVIRMR